MVPTAGKNVTAAFVVLDGGAEGVFETLAVEFGDFLEFVEDDQPALGRIQLLGQVQHAFQAFGQNLSGFEGDGVFGLALRVERNHRPHALHQRSNLLQDGFPAFTALVEYLPGIQFHKTFA